MVESSWSGSETQRRPQGICLPPTLPTNDEPRFSLPAGKTVHVRRLSDGFTAWHKTTIPLGFERYESKSSGKYEFRHEGWIITAKSSQVVLRESERERLSSRRNT